MKEIKFTEEPRNIPQDGVTCLVRDGVLYHTWGVKSQFIRLGESPAETGLTNKVLAIDICNSDVVYQFPNNINIFATLKSSGCLDKYILKNKTVTNEDIIAYLKTSIKSGKIIGGRESEKSRHHVICKEGRSSLILSSPHLGIKDMSWDSFERWTLFEFDNIYELGNWMLTPETK